MIMINLAHHGHEGTYFEKIMVSEPPQLYIATIPVMLLFKVPRTPAFHILDILFLA